MKFLLAVLMLGISAVLCYDTKYDQIDVDHIIGDENLFNAYIECMLDKGPCSIEHSSEYRQIIPEVIATACEKCSDIQKSNIRKSVKALQEKKPKEFQEFRAKFDPKGEYEQKFTTFMVGN